MPPFGLGVTPNPELYTAVHKLHLKVTFSCGRKQ